MIRNFNESDIEILSNYYKKIFNVSKNFNEIANYIKIYEHNNQIIGFIDYSILYERAELNYIYISDDYKKMGYATLLMKYMLDDLKSNNVSSITLEVNVNNNSALKLYQKMGFDIINKREKYYNGEDGYLMYKEVK